MLHIVILFFLVYLTHLDYVDTERIMTEKLHNQVCSLFEGRLS